MKNFRFVKIIFFTKWAYFHPTIYTPNRSIFSQPTKPNDIKTFKKHGGYSIRYTMQQRAANQKIVEGGD